jgi:hypothetical protein
VDCGIVEPLLSMMLLDWNAADFTSRPMSASRSSEVCATLRRTLT